MARIFALSLRLSVIASAIAMLILCVHAAHAQDFQPAPAIDTTPAPPLGLNGAPDPYAYYKPPPPAQNQGYYTALSAPAQQQQQVPPPYQQAPTGPQNGPTPQFASAPQFAPAPMSAETGYTLGPGDKVHVSVFGEDDLSGDYVLDGNGMIRLPLIGTLRAAGYTAPGLEAWIKNALGAGYMKNPRVNVEIAAYRPIYVIGAVLKPGQYAYINDMTMLNAVALAGGFTDQAVQSTVYVRHEGSVTEETVHTDVPLLIRPGDTVRATTTLFWDAMAVFSPLASPAAIAAAAAH